jgi:propanol-preferring alcohol dehydrogenase
MKAMVLERIGEPLQLRELPTPDPAEGEVLVRVQACGVCRTDLHVFDGDLNDPKLPLILGHEVVGTVQEVGSGVSGFTAGQRVGIPWLGKTCGTCAFCRTAHENLCDAPGFTGYQIDGGYAEFTVAHHHYCFPLPDDYPPPNAAPLLCAGLIGYRALRMAGDARHLGLYGFGASAHIIAQVARHQGREFYALTRPGDNAKQDFAKTLGAAWAGDSDTPPPTTLDAAIILAPVGNLVPLALRAVRKGGTVVCAGIHMDDIPSFPYAQLWGERTIRSVANLTRRDGIEFLELAPRVPVRTTVETFGLEDANTALERLRTGRIQGAAVLVTGNA